MVMVALVSTTLFAQQQPTPVEARKISDRLYMLMGGSGANGGFYIGDDAVLVIDSKMNEQSVKEAYDAIAKISDKPIKYLVNTHADGDHVSGNVFMPVAATIVSHDNCRNGFFVTRDGTPSNWLNPEMAKGLPTVTFSERMVLYLGSKKVELSYFGKGHTTGDIYLYFPEEDVAFIGDQFFETRVQLIHTYKGGSAVEYVKTMDKMLAAIPAKQFCSGHSEMASREKVVAHVDKIRAMVNNITALASQGKSIDQVKSLYAEGEAALVEGIYNEVKK